MYKYGYRNDSPYTPLGRLFNILCYVGLTFVWFYVIVCYDRGWHGIGFGDSAVIASHKCDIASFIGSILTIPPMGFAYLLVAGRDPLRDREKRSAPMDKEDRRHVIKLVTFVVLVPLLLLSLTLFGRDTLTVSQELVSYNALNVCSREYQVADCDRLEIIAKDLSHSRESSKWTYVVSFVTPDGRTYTFSRKDFAVEHYSDDEILEYLLDIKAMFPADKIVTDGQEELERVADRWSLTDAEKALLYELYDSPKN